MNSKTVLRIVTLVSCCAVLPLLSGCGSFQAIPQNVIVTVSPHSASVAVNQSIQFAATVQNDSRGVNWQVLNLEFANCTPTLCGTIDQSGKYTAPSSIPTTPGFTTIQIGAFSVSNSTIGDFAVITLLPPPIAVTVTPTNASVQAGQSLQFMATVQNDPANKGVTWSVGNPANTTCTPALCGTIDSNGNYAAPPVVPTPTTLTVIATSVAVPTIFGTSAVTITGGTGANQEPERAIRIFVQRGLQQRLSDRGGNVYSRCVGRVC